jgi:hypothetical protein
MSRREPPPQATWMLENLTSGRRDEALAGDLLEEFRAGRSNGWYWRQVLSACAVSWSKSLAVRGPALAFALLWSALAPAWKIIVDRITATPLLTSMGQVLSPFWLPFALAGWIALHATFLWSGILAYLLAHTILGRTIRQREARRAFWVAPLVFPPIAGLTFVLANLYWYSLPGLAQAKLASTSLGQIADFGILPDLIRIPYFLALLAALWTALPQSKRMPGQFPAGSFGEGMRADVLALESTPDPLSVRRFFGFMVVAGFINALIAGFLLCRLPDAQDPAIGSLLLRAICYVAVGGAAGAMGAYVYWQNPASPFRENPPVPFPLFALVCVSGWVWVPAMVIFSEALSAGAAPVAMIGAFLLAAGLRGATRYLLAPASSAVVRDDPELFEEALYQAPTDLIGYAIAICLYTALIALAARWNLCAAALLALAAALFGWKKTIPQGQAVLSVREYKRAALRVALVAIPAILVTAWALLDGVAYRNRARTGAENGALSSVSRENPPEKQTAKSSAYGVNGYQSVILWPYPEKKQIVLPRLRETAWFAPGAARPVVIRFTGAYWYLQPPDQLPGPKAHQAFGSPLKANIQSSDDIPLVMDAHQTLSEEVPTARCRAIAVEIENFDNKEGPISVALLLGDGFSAPHRTLYLGQQPIVSTQPQHFWFKAAPVSETLHFNVPARTNLQKFNELTVVILPDTGHLFIGRRIAVRQFQLIPR